MEAFNFPGRYIKYKWDGPNMRITNFDLANQFIKREYRKGWGELKIQKLQIIIQIESIHTYGFAQFNYPKDSYGLSNDEYDQYLS